MSKPKYGIYWVNDNANVWVHIKWASELPNYKNVDPDSYVNVVDNCSFLTDDINFAYCYLEHLQAVVFTERDRYNFEVRERQ